MQGVLALDRVTVRDADFSRAAFERFAPNGCVFERCDFRGELFDERLQTLFASRRQSIFRECRFDGADLHGVRPGQARFERCNFARTNIDGVERAWWFHRGGCRRWFQAERDTRDNRVIQTAWSLPAATTSAAPETMQPEGAVDG